MLIPFRRRRAPKELQGARCPTCRGDAYVVQGVTHCLSAELAGELPAAWRRSCGAPTGTFAAYEQIADAVERFDIARNTVRLLATQQREGEHERALVELDAAFAQLQTAGVFFGAALAAQQERRQQVSA